MGRVTEQKVNGACNRIKEDIQEIKEFLKKDFGDERSFNQAEIMKVKLERHLEHIKDLMEKATEQQELEIEIEKYEETAEEAEIKRDELHILIINYNKKRERELQREKELKQLDIQKEKELKEIDIQKEKELKEIEMQKELKEIETQKELKALQMEMEMKEKQMQSEEKLRMENANLERLRLELDSKKQSEMVEAEVKRAEIEATKSTKSTTQHRVETIRLPKLELKKFGGNILKWQEFWDTFEATIHNNPSLQSIDKFNYLRAQLESDALKSIAGLELTNVNYEVAVKLLRERYGNRQLMVDSHYTRLMDMQQAINKIQSLRSTYDTIEQHLRSLQALGEDVNQGQIVSMIRSKLPKAVLTRLEERKEAGKEWTVELLRECLKTYITTQETAENQILLHMENSSTRNNQQRSFQNSKPFSTTETLYSNEQLQGKQKKCVFCQRSHWSDECRTVKELLKRKEALKGKCYVCLKDNHTAKNCKKDKPCYHCKERGKHHRSLCPKLFEQTQTHLSITTDNEEQDVIPEPSMLAVGDQIVMQTALVEATDPNEKYKEPVRVLFDTGSHRTYITEELVNKLNLKSDGTSNITLFTFGSNKPKDIVSKLVTLSLKSKKGNTFTLKANVVPKISGKIQRAPVQIKNQFELQRKYQLADTLPKEVETSSLGLLIGSDYYHEIISSEREKLQDGLYAVKSKFGWIVCGKTNKRETKTTDNSMFVMSYSQNDYLAETHQVTETKDPVIEPDIADLWKLETIGIKPDEDKEDEDVWTHFKNTVRKEDNRYQIVWPWRREVTTLPENYELCIGRLKSLYKRLSQDPTLLEKYDAIIKDQLEKNVIEELNSESEEGQIKHYIPHHVVVKPDSETTKLRVVYDASAKSKKSNLSLNECLYRGPVIMEDLCGLLMRFRTKKIGIVADIEKAFLQVSIQPKERDVTRFIWMKDIGRPPTEDNLQIYRFTRVPWGIISSPFLLGATIKHHLEEGQELQSGTHNLMQDMYVDNLISGVNNDEEAVHFYRDTKKKFSDMSMNIRCWKSNSKVMNNSIPKEDQLEKTIIKVLGLQWNTETDQLEIPKDKFNNSTQATTKRMILAAIASLYDPLGFLSPATIKMRLFLQEIWAKEMDWDDKLNEEDRRKWTSIVKELQTLSNIKVPRFIGNMNIQIITFCDASKDAYAAAVYLKTISMGKTEVNLIFSKSRVKSKKKMSIPRLELLAALIATRCVKFVSKELGLINTQKIIFTDSQCVLHWIKSTKPLSVFVRNRIKEINHCDDTEFRYVNTKENPADIPTKGSSSQDLERNKLWWHGPPWLERNNDSWPTWNVEPINQEVLEKIQSEIKGPETLYETSAIAHMQDKITSPFGIDETKYSSNSKLLRVTAYTNRFVQKILKKQTETGELTANELEDAERRWIKYIQRKHYTEIDNDKITLNKKAQQNQLNLKFDKNGIIRCHGRLNNALLPEETITPVILPKGETFVRLMIEDHHKKHCHAGVNHTLSQIRNKYWIPKGRAEVKFVLRRCRVCRKHQGGPYKMPPMTNWPKSKVNTAIPFETTGLDYFGPLEIKVNQTTEKQKVWVCLFTCVAVRAIHLELVEDLTAEQFLQSLRRFIARRGTPKEIILDNAAQFKLTKSTVDLAWEKIITDPTVHSYVAEQRIKWKFIVELSPWMGGFYERLVGSSKMSLRKSIGKKCLTSMQLQTFLTETEAVLNSRPLVYIGEDLNDRTVITPSHFLTPNQKTGTPQLANDQDEIQDPDYQQNPSSAEILLTTWKKGQNMLESFWKTWRNDYLLNLRERTQTKLKSRRIQSDESPKVGHIVQIKDDLPRGSWRIGKIEDLLLNSEGKVRAAKVRLAAGNTINRPLNLLYPLECQETNQEDVITNEKTEDEQKQDDETERPDSSERKNEKRPKRKAAIHARDRIIGQHLSDD